MSDIGHNSGDVGGIAADRLRSFIERVERLNEEKKAITEDTKKVFSEAKSAGFDNTVMREIIKIRAKDRDAQNEFESLVEVYRDALDM